MSKKKPNFRDEEIGRRIRSRRMTIGMSQSILGERLGLTFQQVQKYEKGNNRIGAGRLEEIGIILEVPITFFFDDAEIGSSNVATLLDLINNAQTLKLLRAFSQIESSIARQAIVNLAVELGAARHEAA